MPSPKTPIIIKKIKKGHEEHHGGGWKVAFADFATAMMAFFLLMWLLAMVDPDKREGISTHFREATLFGGPGVSVMGQPATQLISPGNELMPGGRGGGPGTGPGDYSPEGVAKKLRGTVDERFSALRDQVLVDLVEGGVSIQIVDNDGGLMFLSGRAEPTEQAREILRTVAENIRRLPYRIAVEGHTDSAPMKTGGVSNWELSMSRASAARRELEVHGIDPARIARVVGYADQELYIKHNPMDPRNRRISIVLIDHRHH